MKVLIELWLWVQFIIIIMVFPLGRDQAWAPERLEERLADR